MRSALVSSLSLLLIVLAAVFVFTPASVSFADQAQTTRISSKSTVFYGKVTDTKGKPIHRARVVIYQYSRGHQNIRAIVYTGKNGTYRKVLKLRGRTWVQISVRSGGEIVKTKPRSFVVSLGHAYRVSAKLVRQSVLVFVPLFTY
jgi:hypothetical protein